VKYVGSKRRIARHLIPFIYQHLEGRSAYVEPFCGGCGMLERVKTDKPRVAGDVNPYLIALLSRLSQKGIPNLGVFSEDEYRCVRDNPELYPQWLVGYAGFNS